MQPILNSFRFCSWLFVTLTITSRFVVSTPTPMTPLLLNTTLQVEDQKGNSTSNETEETTISISNFTNETETEVDSSVTETMSPTSPDEMGMSMVKDMNKMNMQPMNVSVSLKIISYDPSINKSGRNLDLEFAETGSKSDNKQMVDSSSDTAGRIYVRDKLCNLGLGSCAGVTTSKNYDNERVIDRVQINRMSKFFYPQSPTFPPKNNGFGEIRPIFGGGEGDGNGKHIIHHVHHISVNPGVKPVIGQQYENGNGNSGIGNRPSIDFASPIGGNIGGSFPESPSALITNGGLNSNRVVNCKCVTIRQCASYDIVQQGYDTSGREPIQGTTGTGRPNAGLVGVNIDPRGTSTTTLNLNITNESSSRSGLIPNQNRINCQGGSVCCKNPVKHPNSNNPENAGGFQNQNDEGFDMGYGQCGKRNARGITGRVSHSSQTGFTKGETEYGEYPWQAAILRKDGKDNVFICGGSLLDSRHILTAAHCIKGLNPADLRVRLGEWDVNFETEFYPHFQRDVAGFIIHPEFYTGNLFNDIAIVRLEGLVDFRQSPHISPICVPPTNYEFGGQRCFVTGWGKNAFGEVGKFQNVLKEVDVSVMMHSECELKLKRTRLGADFVLHPGFICAGGEEGKDACGGDGGGPLVCDIQDVWQLTGIVSWGVGCGKRDTPGVYVRVSHYKEWIRQSISI